MFWNCCQWFMSSRYNFQQFKISWFTKHHHTSLLANFLEIKSTFGKNIFNLRFLFLVLVLFLLNINICLSCQRYILLSVWLIIKLLVHWGPVRNIPDINPQSDEWPEHYLVHLNRSLVNLLVLDYNVKILLSSSPWLSPGDQHLPTETETNLFRNSLTNLCSIMTCFDQISKYQLNLLRGNREI